MNASQTPTRRTVFARALRLLCPNCGKGRLFSGYYTLSDGCSHCGMDFNPLDGNTWFFMYMTSGAVIGACFLILLAWRPQQDDLHWASAVMIGGALVALVGSLRIRKALGIAVDYVLEPPVDSE